MLHEYPQMRVFIIVKCPFLGTLNYTPTKKKRTLMKEDSRSSSFFLWALQFSPKRFAEAGIWPYFIGFVPTVRLQCCVVRWNLEKASEQIRATFSNQIYYLSSQRSE